MEVVVVFNNSTDENLNSDDSNAFVYGEPAPVIPTAAVRLYSGPSAVFPDNGINGIAAGPTFGMAAPFFDSALDEGNGPLPPDAFFPVGAQTPPVPVGVVYLREPKILAPNILTTTLPTVDSATRSSSLDELSSLLQPPPHINQEMLSIILICAGIVAGILFIGLLLLCRWCVRRRDQHRMLQRLRMEGFLPAKSSLLQSPFPAGAQMMYNDSGNEKASNTSYHMSADGGGQIQRPSVTDEESLSPLPMSMFAQGVPTAAAVPMARDEDTASSRVSPQDNRPSPPNMFLYAPVATVQVPPNLQPAPSNNKHVVFSAATNAEQQVASTRLYQHPTEGISYIQSPMPTAKVTFAGGRNTDAESVRTTTIQIHQNGPFKWQAVETPVLASSPAAGAGEMNEPLDAGNLLKIALYSPGNVMQNNLGNDRRRAHHHHHRRSGSRNRNSKSRSRSRERQNHSGSAEENGGVGGVTLVQSRTHPEFLFQAADAKERQSRLQLQSYGSGYRNLNSPGVGNTLNEVKQARRRLRQASPVAGNNIPYSNIRLSRHTEV